MLGVCVVLLAVLTTATAQVSERTSQPATESAGGEPGLRASYTDQELIEILHGMGYYDAAPIATGMLEFTVGVRQLLLLNNSDGDLQLYFAMTGGSWNYRDMNEWNKTHRLSRAYLDDDGDPVLEADLLSNGGMTVTRVRDFVDIFGNGSSGAFEGFLTATDGSSDFAPAEPAHASNGLLRVVYRGNGSGILSHNLLRSEQIRAPLAAARRSAPAPAPGW